MIQLIKKSIKILALVFVLLISIPHTVLAADEIDQQKNVSLDIHYAYKNNPVADVSFRLYYVADVVGPGEYILTQAFENYPIELENLEASQWRALAQTLSYYVQADKMTPLDQGYTDKEGIMEFPNQKSAIKPGLYLVNAQPKTDGQYTYYTEPFFVCLPTLDSETGEWNYNPSVVVKYTREENSTSPELETVTRKVQKIWKNDNKEVRPEEITVELLKNGTVYDTVILKKGNNWRYTWKDLPKNDENGKKIEWGIAERNVKDYSVSVYLEGSTFVLTNTYQKDVNAGQNTGATQRPSLPQTGVLWWPVPVGIVAGLFFLILGKALKEREYDD